MTDERGTPFELPIDQVIHGDALAVLSTFPDNSVDAIITDPPSGISFMGRSWDTFSNNKSKRKFVSQDDRILANARYGVNRFGNSHGRGETTPTERDNFIAFLTSVMAECLRIIRPGGHAFVWSLPRTSHWTGMALEYAGFELRDCCYHLYAQDAQIQAFLDSLTQSQQDALERILANHENSAFLHIFGSGMPKSHNIGRAIDRLAGAEREVVGIARNNVPHYRNSNKGSNGRTNDGRDAKNWNEYTARDSFEITAPSTPEAQKYNGFGTGMKPSVEMWWLARKPLGESTVAKNVLKYGTGAINIDGCRIGYASKQDAEPKDYSSSKGIGTYQEWSKDQGARQYVDGLSYTKNDFVAQTHPAGRWPSHLLMSHSLWCTEDVCSESCPIWLLDQQSGRSGSGTGKTKISSGEGFCKTKFSGSIGIGEKTINTGIRDFGDQGGASRYFAQFAPDVPFLYASKASRRERNEGCEDLPARKGFDKNTSQQIAHINHNTGEATYNDYQPSANQNSHPTVKNLALMRYLCRMICPKSGIVLDPFGGSGSTALACIGEGMHYILIEEQDTEEEPYCSIARSRIAHAMKKKEGHV